VPAEASLGAEVPVPVVLLPTHLGGLLCAEPLNAEPPERRRRNRMSKFTVYADKQNEFRWKFMASNNSVIAKSYESFKRKEDCLVSLSLLQKDITGAAIDHEVRAAVDSKVTAQSPITPAIVVAADSKVVVPTPALAASPAVSPAPVVVAQN
jgi:uncharacterized protein YegP (UPF0339 family)